MRASLLGVPFGGLGGLQYFDLYCLWNLLASPPLDSSDSPPRPRLLLLSSFRCLTRPQSQEATKQVLNSQSRVVSLAPTSRMCGFFTRLSRSLLTRRSTWTGASAASRRRAPIIFQCDGESAHDVIVLIFSRLESGVAAMRAGMVH